MSYDAKIQRTLRQSNFGKSRSALWWWVSDLIDFMRLLKKGRV
ncbi:hypothetical protein [Candidatus Terasakiella magnetica]|nr:hypothetical protein [Candidatus Terasakiella magnetica]